MTLRVRFSSLARSAQDHSKGLGRGGNRPHCSQNKMARLPHQKTIPPANQTRAGHSLCRSALCYPRSALTRVAVFGSGLEALRPKASVLKMGKRRHSQGCGVTQARSKDRGQKGKNTHQRHWHPNKTALGSSRLPQLERFLQGEPLHL